MVYLRLGRFFSGKSGQDFGGREDLSNHFWEIKENPVRFLGQEDMLK